jgi:hypothetical protein
VIACVCLHTKHLGERTPWACDGCGAKPVPKAAAIMVTWNGTFLYVMDLCAGCLRTTPSPQETALRHTLAAGWVLAAHPEAELALRAWLAELEGVTG